MAISTDTWVSEELQHPETGRFTVSGLAPPPPPPPTPTLAKDIQRPLYSIYQRMLLIFDESSRFGKYVYSTCRAYTMYHRISVHRGY